MSNNTIVLTDCLITKETDKAVFLTHHVTTGKNNVVIEGWFPKSRIGMVEASKLDPNMASEEALAKANARYADVVVEEWLLRDKHQQTYSSSKHYAK
jgi:hypothetical protein